MLPFGVFLLPKLMPKPSGLSDIGSRVLPHAASLRLGDFSPPVELSEQQEREGADLQTSSSPCRAGLGILCGARQSSRQTSECRLRDLKAKEGDAISFFPICQKLL